MEEQVPWPQSVRPENRIQEMLWHERIGYLWKYLAAPKLGAPASVMSHFEEQKKLQAQLRFSEGVTTREVAARLGFVGDLMWIRSHWATFLPATTLEELQGFDGIVGNLETAISPRFPVHDFLPDVLRFNSDKRLITEFRSKDKVNRNLFAALGLANNHALDFGDLAAEDTIQFLKENNICTAGLRMKDSEKSWTEFERGGIRFGFYAACFGVNDSSDLKGSKLTLEVMPGLAPELVGTDPDLSKPIAALNEMRDSRVDVKIVMLHWGSEFEFYPSLRNMRVARALVGSGADFILGAHPHVPNPMELLFVNGCSGIDGDVYPSVARGGACRLDTADAEQRIACVLYSLGNFTTNMFTTFCRAALLADVSFYRDPRTGKVSWGTPKPVFFYNQPPGWGRPRALVRLEDVKARFGGARFAEKVGFLYRHLSADLST